MSTSEVRYLMTSTITVTFIIHPHHHPPSPHHPLTLSQELEREPLRFCKTCTWICLLILTLARSVCYWVNSFKSSHFMNYAWVNIVAEKSLSSQNSISVLYKAFFRWSVWHYGFLLNANDNRPVVILLHDLFFIR